ncbi:hypothetical protein PRUPE_3G153500 [Prunus persica]|uniref:Amino acid transporter transmembrane domain-containing protein n=1 Tax=Prunus persica TaxID=3760 RepID=M5XEV8_PRUPE|nr:hypothetical protein PRUPE_3G153500 [Prunus persica]
MAPSRKITMNILLFVIAAAAFYSGLLIQRCMDEDSTIRTYPDIGEHAFGKKGRIDKKDSKIAIWTTLVNPPPKYALMVTPIIYSAKNWFPNHCNNGHFDLLLSSSLVISSVVVALAVPFFAYLVSLVGAFLSVSASLLFPCFCYLKISATYRNLGCEMLIIGFIILMGAAVMILGTYTAVSEIIEHL